MLPNRPVTGFDVDIQLNSAPDKIFLIHGKIISYISKQLGQQNMFIVLVCPGSNNDSK